MTDSNIVNNNLDSHTVNVQEHASILTTVQSGIASAKQELEYWKSQPHQENTASSAPGNSPGNSLVNNSTVTDPVGSEIKRLEEFIAEETTKLETLSQNAIAQGESFVQEVIHYVDVFGAEIIAGLEWIKSKLHL